MKQIPSQFIDDDEHTKLIKLKLKNKWTWKKLILSVLERGGQNL